MRRLRDSTEASVATRSDGTRSVDVAVLVCPQCFCRHYPMWAVSAVGGRERWLHTVPAALEYCFVSANFGVEVSLLRWFEALWVADGTRFENFAAAYGAFFECPRAAFQKKDFLHAYVLWSSLCWVAERVRQGDPRWLDADAAVPPGVGHVWASVPYFDCRIGNQGATIEEFLAPLRSYWYPAFNEKWVTKHSEYCSSNCAAVMLLDGSAKNYRTGCPAEIAPLDFHGVAVRRMCGRPVQGLYGCAVHGHVPCPPPRQSGGARRGQRECATLKERHHPTASNRSFGCLSTAFQCRTFGPFYELSYAESCSHVYMAENELKSLNPDFAISIYDDGCHMREFWLTRPSQLHPGWSPRHFIPRSHLRGHVRLFCQEYMCPDSCSDLYKYILRSVNMSAADSGALAAALDRNGCLRRDIAVAGVDVPKNATVQAAGGKRMDARCNLITALQHDPLPVWTAWQQGDTRVELSVNTSAQRTALLARFDPLLRLKGPHPVRLRDAQGQAAWVRKGAALVAAGVFRRDGREAVRQALAAGGAVSGVTVVKTSNTEAVEENWRFINRHKATLRHAGAEMYFYLLHRIAHLLNVRRWRDAEDE